MRTRGFSFPCSGQSLVEYVVTLALVTIIVVTVVAGIGQQTRGRVAQANDAFSEPAVASRTSGGKPAVGSPGK